MIAVGSLDCSLGGASHKLTRTEAPALSKIRTTQYGGPE